MAAHTADQNPAHTTPLSDSGQAEESNVEDSKYEGDDGEIWTPVAPGKIARRTPTQTTNSSNPQRQKMYMLIDTGDMEITQAFENSVHDRGGNPIIPSEK